MEAKPPGFPSPGKVEKLKPYPLGMPRLEAEAFGAVAQLGERVVRNDEVSGSIPLSSTKLMARRVVPPGFGKKKQGTCSGVAGSDDNARLISA